MTEELRLVCAGVAALWLLGAVLRAFLPLGLRARAMWVLVLAGVPLLGWLTISWGPTVALVGFAGGAALLLRPPRRRGRDAGGRIAARP